MKVKATGSEKVRDPDPEEGCVRSFQQYSSLEKHMDCGKHRYTVRILEYSVCP